MLCEKSHLRFLLLLCIGIQFLLSPTTTITTTTITAINTTHTDGSPANAFTFDLVCAFRSASMRAIVALMSAGVDG